MAAVLERIKDFFTGRLYSPTVIQLTPSYLSGIHLDLKDGPAKYYAVLELPSGLIEPHFERKNIADAAALSEVLKEAVRLLQIPGKKITCLVPEACLKIFVLSFESLPASEKERQKIIRWRAKKQMAILPEDARLSYETLSSSPSSIKVLAALARAPVIQEYEDLFVNLGLEVGNAASPTISLLNLVDWQNERDVLIVNIEEDSLSLVAVTQSEPSLYRLKTFSVGQESGLRFSQKIEAAVKEIENTLHFIEDREKRTVHSLWYRSGLKEGLEGILAGLRTGFEIDVRPFIAPPWYGLDPSLSAFLAPLAGQVPWQQNRPAV